MTAFRILLTLVLSFVFLILLGFIDYKVLTPLLPLPDDICYYHTNVPPIWVRLFYLDSSGHTEIPYSKLHMLTLFTVSGLLGFLTTRMIDNWLIKKRQKNIKINS